MVFKTRNFAKTSTSEHWLYQAAFAAWHLVLNSTWGWSNQLCQAAFRTWLWATGSTPLRGSDVARQLPNRLDFARLLVVPSIRALPEWPFQTVLKTWHLALSSTRAWNWCPYQTRLKAWRLVREWFNQRLGLVTLPSSLQSLNFGRKLNKGLPHVMLPSELLDWTSFFSKIQEKSGAKGIGRQPKLHFLYWLWQEFERGVLPKEFAKQVFWRWVQPGLGGIDIPKQSTKPDFWRWVRPELAGSDLA